MALPALQFTWPPCPSPTAGACRPCMRVLRRSAAVRRRRHTSGSNRRRPGLARSAKPRPALQLDCVVCARLCGALQFTWPPCPIPRAGAFRCPRVAPQRFSSPTPPHRPVQSTPSWPDTRRSAATGTTARLCGVRIALPRLHLTWPHRPSLTAGACRPCSRVAPQRRSAPPPPHRPVQTPAPGPGTPRAAATGTRARLCGVRTALPRPSFHLTALPQPHSRRLLFPACSLAAPKRVAAAIPLGPIDAALAWHAARSRDRHHSSSLRCAHGSVAPFISPGRPAPAPQPAPAHGRV